ncbi:DUF4011 domain-containing protein [Actinoplanes sp. NBRC 101535]|uniref:DUF4011 domain-containing protein n=1 Tax=Actinoplanes sp. NBRC 101535 TaxID=3032196 RepID=UPI00249F9635|nr:DUF4011 domain-containing protein [Actinoplanes sp. NBRC 101535]GLY04564.1 hypothetical protein Acsp01_49430 [Actinoplanes sp. NBRC 101535]
MRGDAEPNPPVLETVRRWRDGLVDLSERNPLLRFRMSRAGAVRILSPGAAPLLDGMRAGTAVRISPSDVARGLRTDRTAEELVPLLRDLQRRSHREFLERGRRTLHLAVGSLSWADDDDIRYSSPLVLVPLRPGPAGDRLVAEEPVVNPVLAVRLRQVGIVLPASGDLAAIRAAVSGRAGWRVTEPVMLSCFSYGAEAMYQDLLDNEAVVVAHPIVRALAGEESGREDEPGTADDVETRVEVDPDQRAAVAAALAGRSFVLDGPPGTGKSQTVAAMIGALRQAGRRVLFVAEKAAALDMVRRRLGVEPHSHLMPEATREAVAKLAGAWRPAAEGPDYLWRDVTFRGSLDARLAESASALHTLTGIAAAHAPLAAAFGVDRLCRAPDLARLVDLGARRPSGVPVQWLTAERLDPFREAAGRLAVELRELAGRRDAADRAAGVPWFQIPVPDSLPGVDTTDGGDLTAEQATALAGTFGRDAATLREAGGRLAELADTLGLPPVVSFGDAEATLVVAELGRSADRPERVWLSAAGRADADRAVRELRQAGEALAAAERAATPYFTEDLLGTDVDGLARRFAYPQQVLKKLGGTYRADKRALAIVTRPDVTWQDARDHLSLGVAWNQAVTDFAQAESRHGVALGAYYTGRGTDYAPIARALATADVAIRRARTSELGKLADHIARDAIADPGVLAAAEEIRRMLPGRDDRAAMPITEAAGRLDGHQAPLLAAAEVARSVSRAVHREVTVRGAVQLLEFRSAVDAGYARIAASGDGEVLGTLYAGDRTDMRAVTSALDWAKRMRACLTGDDTPLSGAQAAALDGVVPAPRLSDVVQRWTRARADLLAAFTPARQTGLAAELDDYAGAEALVAALRADPTGPQEWFAHQDARAELDGLGDDIDPSWPPGRVRDTLSIKPFVMTSPSAVSRNIPAGTRFDVVIVDEAGRLTPADLLGCVYRGDALIVAGDPAQLPPPDASASVLDLMAGGFRSFRLRRHYRSRHASLAAFPNEAFYRGELVPVGTDADAEEAGLEVFPVDGVFRRGAVRDNPVEAAAVAERVRHHFTVRPHLTLGVVALSEAQAAAIERAVDDAHLDEFFTDDRLDGFFVKSVEAAQGDERDVVILSVGYGPDETGRTTPNFVPLTREGGWRRLNVAVTRARRRLEVVTSLRPADISATTGSEGLRYLRRFLDYAAAG